MLRAAFHGAAVLLAAVAVSVGTLGHGLVFDDHMLVVGNAPVIRGEEPLSTAFTYRYWGAADEASPNELYRPITVASLAINARLTGQDPAGLHAGNVALHALNALLVYWLVRALFEPALVAWLAATLFAVHPVATEPVAAIAGRADLLSTLLTLTSCLLALAVWRRRGAAFVAGALAMGLVTFMAALSKESAFVAPLLTMTVLWADPRRPRATRGDRGGALLAAGAVIGVQILTLAMALLLRHRMLGYVYQAGPPIEPSAAYLAFVNNPIQFCGPVDRILTGVRVAARAAGLLALPIDLSADYSYDEIPVSRGAPGLSELGSLAFVALYAGALAWSARRFRLAPFALAWSAFAYAIVSNVLFPIGTIFGERLLYLPSIGFAVLTAGMVAALCRGAPWRKGLAAAIAVVLIGGYAARFVDRCRDWGSDDLLFAAAVKVSPRSAKAHSNYGFTLQRAGRLEEAMAEYRLALQIAPGLTGTGISLARTLSVSSRHEEAIDIYRNVIERDGGISFAWSGLGLCQRATGRIEEAEASFRKALELSLGRSGEALAGLAALMLASGREAEVVDLLEAVAAGGRGPKEIRSLLAQAHYALGARTSIEERREHFLDEMRAAVAADPEHGPANYNLALDALQQGQVDQARRYAQAGMKSGYSFPPGFLQACGIDAAPTPAP